MDRSNYPMMALRASIRCATAFLSIWLLLGDFALAGTEDPFPLGAVLDDAPIDIPSALLLPGSETTRDAIEKIEDLVRKHRGSRDALTLKWILATRYINDFPNYVAADKEEGRRKAEQGLEMLWALFESFPGTWQGQMAGIGLAALPNKNIVQRMRAPMFGLAMDVSAIETSRDRNLEAIRKAYPTPFTSDAIKEMLKERIAYLLTANHDFARARAFIREAALKNEGELLDRVQREEKGLGERPAPLRDKQFEEKYLSRKLDEVDLRAVSMFSKPYGDLAARVANDGQRSVLERINAFGMLLYLNDARSLEVSEKIWQMGSTGDAQTRERLALAIGMTSRPIPPVAKMLEALSDDRDTDVVRAVAWAIGNVPNNPDALPIIAKLKSRVSGDKDARRTLNVSEAVARLKIAFP